MPTIEEQLRNYSAWLADEADHRAGESPREVLVRLADNEEEPDGRRWQPLIAVAAVVVLLAGGVWLSSLRAGDDPAVGTSPPSPTDAPDPTTEEIAPPDPVQGDPNHVELGGMQVPVTGEPFERDGRTFWQGARHGVETSTEFGSIGLEEFASLDPAGGDADVVVVLGVLDGVAYGRVAVDVTGEGANQPTFAIIEVPLSGDGAGASALVGADLEALNRMPGRLFVAGPSSTMTALVGFPGGAATVSYASTGGTTESAPIVGDTAIIPGDHTRDVIRSHDADGTVLRVDTPLSEVDPDVLRIATGEPIERDGVRIWKPATRPEPIEKFPVEATVQKLGPADPADLWLGTHLPEHFTDAVVIGEWNDQVVARLFSQRDEGLRVMFSPVDGSGEPLIAGSATGRFVNGPGFGVVDVSDVDPTEALVWIRNADAGMLAQHSIGGLVIVDGDWFHNGVVVGLDAAGNEIHRVGEGYLPTDPPPDSVTVRPLDQSNVDPTLLDQLGDPTLVSWEPTDPTDVPALPGLEGDATVLGQLDRAGSEWMVVRTVDGIDTTLSLVELGDEGGLRLDNKSGGWADRRWTGWTPWFRVPDGAAIVEYKLGDVHLAQVPVDGLALFPARSDWRLDGSSGMSLIAYDAAGYKLEEHQPPGLDDAQ